MSIRKQWRCLALALAAAAGANTAATLALGAAGEACIPTERVTAHAAGGGTVVFSVVPEGLPEGAEIVQTIPCAGVSRLLCLPEERPLYYVPCTAAGPSVCAPGQAYLAACWDSRSCPAGTNTTLFWAAIDECPFGGLTSITFRTTVRCPDDALVVREAVLFVTLPGDCNRDGVYEDLEVRQVIAAMFDPAAGACESDLNLDGRITADELQKVAALALRDAETGEPCPDPGVTPTPTPG